MLPPSIMEAFDDMWSWNAPLQHNLPHNTQSERLRNIWLIFSIGEHVCQGLSACSWSCRRFANFYFSCPRIKQRDGGRIFRRQRLRLRRSRRNSKSWISSQDKIQLNEVPFQKMERTQEGKHMEDEWWKRKGSVFFDKRKERKESNSSSWLQKCFAVSWNSRVWQVWIANLHQGERQKMTATIRGKAIERHGRKGGHDWFLHCTEENFTVEGQPAEDWAWPATTWLG